MPARRQFIKTLLAGSMAFSMPASLVRCASNDETLTLLHTNDVHSHIEPFPADHPHLANQGGFARRMTLVKQLRTKNKHLLLLDAGDIFQGTPYFNLFGGELELKLMSRMQYDAATLGNHEFDNGINHLARQLPNATFPFVCTNYHFENTPLQGKTVPWLILNKGPFKIGIIGLGIDPQGLIMPDNWSGMQWSDPIKAGEETAFMLKNEAQCNLVIALSHLGLVSKYPKGASDQGLAQNSKSIDIIIGGHTHTFMDTPQILLNKNNEKVLINQMGWGGVRLGRIDLCLCQNKIHYSSFNYLLQ